MAYEYEYEIKIPMWLEDGRWLNMNVDDEVLDELEEVYRKAKAWDRLYDMILDEDMTIREFDDEMYGLLKQTGKTNIRIITDPSIRMEDE